MKEGSLMLVASDDGAIIEKAYDAKVDNGEVWLDGVLSRKKQVVPPLQDAFA
jgi:manganese-dependent inorganic pyrophosphatase